MNQIARIIDSAFSDGLTYFFVMTICGLFILALFVRPLMALTRAQWLRRFYTLAPTLLTTLGVLGTFTGIFLGLLDFDVANIDDSVPRLLDGLKVAFVTSICGMAAMILLRSFQAVVPQPVAGESGATPDIIHGTLEAIKEGIDKASQMEQQALDELRKAVSAEADSSLLTQVQKLRTDVKDGQAELIREFRQFAETMAENNSKAIIEALENVIRDFNTQLNEQFGENFRQLNQAVGALLKWQENYRQHVENLEARFGAAMQGIEASERAIRDIVAHTETIPPALERLEQIVQRIGDATIEFSGLLGTVAGLREQALQAFPVIEKNLNQVTDDLSIAMTAADNRFQEFDQKMEQQLHRSIEGLGQRLAALSERFVEDYTPLTERLREIVRLGERA